MSSDLCLCIDLGTGGLKVGLVSLDGEVLTYELHPVATEFGPDGRAVQDAAAWWALITQSTQRLVTHEGVTRDAVKAVAVTGQYASTVPVDANGEPTGPCLTWLDTRGAAHSRQAIGGWAQGYSARKVLQFIRKTGGAPSTTGADPIGQILYLRNEEPDLVERTSWFMEPVDYLTMRFSGVASATHASRTVMWMTDNRHLDRFSYDESLLGIVGLDAQKLPPLVPFGSIVGTITSNVAATLGLSPDTVVVTGVPDLHAAALGSGATNMYDTHLALSTSSWISCPVPQKKTDVAHSIAAVPGLTNDSYVIVNNQETGAKALEWLRSVVAGSGSTMNYTNLAALAATSPVGANGVSFTPWLAGERSPADDRLVRAGFQNLSITSSTADLARAVFEGVALNSAWLFDYVEKFAGRRLNPIRLLGGGAQSPLWCQIYADVLDRQIEQVRQPMVAQLRGVAHLAAIARGQYGVRDVSARTRSGSIYEPDSSASERYQLLRTALKGHYKAERRWSRGIGKTLR